MTPPTTVPLLRVFARLRRHTALLCATLLAHSLWMAASATCESVTAGGPERAVASGPGSAAPVHVHGVPASVPASRAHASHAPLAAHAIHDAAPTQSPVAPLPPHPVACPMAMACAVSAMQVDVPTLHMRTLAQHEDVRDATATMPRSVLSAPEPPPPRA